VKAADVLVRYKNDFINEEEAANVIVTLLLQNIEGIKNPLLRWGEKLVRNLSYRLTNAHRNFCRQHLLARIKPEVTVLLKRYRAGLTSFKEAKETLMALMQRAGTVEYIRPAFLKSTPDGNY
jgi:hypothetical protein